MQGSTLFLIEPYRKEYAYLCICLLVVFGGPDADKDMGPAGFMAL